MASNYSVGGTDLDSVFAPWHSGWPQAAATGYEVAGTDLNARYAPLSTGSAASATNYKVAGADLNTIFAAYGSTGVAVGTQPSNVSGSSAAGNPSGTVTSNAATCSFTKGSGTYSVTWRTTNCTATSPNSETTTFYATVNAGSTDSASAYCTGSDGVSSVNTNTISVSLTNTTPAGFSFTMLAGTVSPYIGFHGNDYGELNGSYNPLQMPSGYYALVISDYTGSPNSFEVEISGLTADPTISGLTSVIINGKTFDTNAAGVSYVYNSNLSFATWTWPSETAGLVNGNSYSVVLSGTVVTG